MSERHLVNARRLATHYQRQAKALAAVLMDARGLVRGMDRALDERIDEVLIPFDTPAAQPEQTEPTAGGDRG